MKEKKLYMIGNAHLDPVWLWNWQEGFQEAKATFQSALDRMDEDPDFVFTCSSAAFYEWIEKNNPAMFARIKKRVEEGRWELAGGWWIQPDCNIPSGESFVRQGLYGQRYFLEKFGKTAVTGYNVDSFGHNGNLPQILKKSGLDNYVFMRPMPLEKGLPGRTFWWESMDGSRVMTYRIPYEYCSWGKDLEKYTDRLKCELLDGENELMMFYGVGNHGGGPTRENIRSIHALNAREDMPVMEMDTTASFFEKVRHNGREYPVHIGDLQHHASGCYSVLSRVKRENRRAEDELVRAEMWSSIAAQVEGQPYPEDFRRAWKGVLFNQFHDILAGTSIPSAYEDASYLYGQAMAIGQENVNYAIQAISWDINIGEDTTMRPIVVFNSHAWEGMMAVDLEVRGLTNDNFKLTDAAGNVIPAQRIQSEATVNGQSRLLFAAKLPSMGYEVFRLYLNVEDAPRFAPVSVSEDGLENGRFRLRFDNCTGYVSSLYDKQEELEVLRRAGGRLKVIEDRHDTWAHNVFKFDHLLGEMQLVYKKVLEEGPVRSSVRVKYKYNQSYVVQDFRMYQALDFVEVKVSVDWREHCTQLKISYPVNLNFRRPTYEIPYGYIEKSANGEEEPGQSWFDFTGEHFQKGVMYGLAIANDAKYSYNMDIDEMNLTVLKNSVFAHHDPKQLEPDTEYRFVDDGLQEFTYILLPHAGSWKEAKVTRHAREINVRPLTVIETYHKGSQPQKRSFLSLDSDHIQISAMKESEDKDGVIVRAYETGKRPGKAVLRADFMNREAELSFAPCEIKTVKLPYDHSLPVVEVNLLEREEH
ncbi:MAG: glycoside hydrolase family 38 C-terminal domain-containing protein [Eubacteriales bacterium]|nr:glycoside hydrolase family 38 C-terminal domain-containing protein [Eubacteriales bacterium]